MQKYDPAAIPTRSVAADTHYRSCCRRCYYHCVRTCMCVRACVHAWVRAYTQMLSERQLLCHWSDASIHRRRCTCTQRQGSLRSLVARTQQQRVVRTPLQFVCVCDADEESHDTFFSPSNFVSVVPEQLLYHYYHHRHSHRHSHRHQHCLNKRFFRDA